jgi:GNAT superfamily N-acetyltransferase
MCIGLFVSWCREKILGKLCIVRKLVRIGKNRKSARERRERVVRFVGSVNAGNNNTSGWRGASAICWMITRLLEEGWRGGVTGIVSGVFITKPKDRSVPMALLSDLWVEESERGKGVAKSLHEEFVKDVSARGARVIDVHIDTRNREGFVFGTACRTRHIIRNDEGCGWINTKDLVSWRAVSGLASTRSSDQEVTDVLGTRSFRADEDGGFVARPLAYAAGKSATHRPTRG